jgi:hypothetical protein
MPDELNSNDKYPSLGISGYVDNIRGVPVTVLEYVVIKSSH